MTYSVTEVCQALTALGHRAHLFDEVVLEALPSFSKHSAVCRLVDVHREVLTAEVRSMSPDDRVAFVRAVAMLEQAVGGMGSVSAILYLLPVLGPERRKAIELALSDTPQWERRCNAWALGAGDILDYDSRQRALWERRDAHARKFQSEKETKLRRRSANLHRAIRNKDVKAVAELLELGVDPHSVTSEGLTCLELAKQVGVSANVENIQRAINSMSSQAGEA